MKKNIIFTILLLISTQYNNNLSAQSTPTVLTSFSTHDSYNAYFNFAVNNTHFIDNDELGNIYVVFADSIKQLTVLTRNGGTWYL